VRPHLSLPINEPSQVGDARRAAARMASEVGFDETRSGQLALVVNELGNNLVRHAQAGRLLLGVGGKAEQRCIEVLSVDAGPGMADVDRCLADGYSTGGTPGTGFGAVKRLSDRFSVYSAVGDGTIILSRIGRLAGPTVAAPFEVGGISLAAPGETVSGDAWCFEADKLTGRVLLADGLGHGPDAAEAADLAAAFFARSAGTPCQVLSAAHPVMRGTRGAAVAAATLDGLAKTITFCGTGNISGRVISGIEDRSLLSQHGTLGAQIRKLTDIVYPWPAHALLVLHSDGITSRWTLDKAPGLLQCDPAVIAAWLLREHLRGRDDATVVVIRAH
jgi:anti-sigma regulatory factor (Ser/Thr protein kinase)